MYLLRRESDRRFRETCKTEATGPSEISNRLDDFTAQMTVSFVTSRYRTELKYFKLPKKYLFLNINELDTLNFIISLFQASTCFEHMCLSSGGQKLYYTVSGIITI